MSSLNLALSDAPAPAVLASLLGGLPEPTGRNRRVHERLNVHDLDWLKSARLRFGPLLSLIDLSAGGALFETTAPLRPGASAVLTISGRGVAETASFRVLRCEVSSLQQGLVYRGACVFDRMIQIPGAQSLGSVTLREDAASQDEAIKLIQSLSARTTDPARMNRVLSEIRAAVERGESPDSVLHFLEREVAGATKGRPATMTAPGLLIDAPTAVPPAPAPRSASPAPDGRPATGPLPGARSATPAAARPAASSATARPAPVRPAAFTPPAAPAVPAKPVAAQGQPTGTHAGTTSAWNKLVVRYLDGTLLKGFSQDFHPGRPFFHLAPSITPGAETSMVPMQQLKAVFFVRDFDGDPSHVKGRTFDDADRVQGRRVEVTFADGELMVGTTLGYRPDGSGFFVRPADGDGNNLRVFVLPNGVKRVRYL